MKPDNIIFKTIAGSQLYGMATKDSDIDIRGVCLEPIDSLIGLNNFEQWENPDKDEVIYGLKKFCRLAMASNPNILELLYADSNKDAIIEITGDWKSILIIREKFLAKEHILNSFIGYAYSQVKRIETHYKWLTGEIPPMVTQEDFGGFLRDDKSGYKWPNNDAQNKYSNAHTRRKQYEDWVKNRNPERAELEKKYHFDTKFGSHILRLMFQGKELLETGKMIFPRPEAKYLLEVREGLLTYQELLRLFEKMKGELDEECKKSRLPEKADFNLINDIIKWIYLEYLGIGD